MRERGYQAVITIIILMICVTTIIPLFYVVSTSLVHEYEFIEKGGFVLWPSNPTLDAYRRLMEMEIIFNSFRISVLRTVIGTALMLLATTITAYIVSRRNMPGVRLLMLVILITILFHGGLIPTFLVMNDIGLYNNFWVMILILLVDPWSVLVLRQFIANLPRELEESANLDGANEVQLFFWIIIPSIKPSLAAIAMFFIVYHWNDWFTPFIYIENPRLMPLQLIIRNILVANEGTNALIGTQIGVDIFDPTRRVGETTLRFATVVFGTVPILMVYPFLQKYFVKGMYMGAVKE